MQRPVVFHRNPRGATVGYSYEMQKANKTYKCDDLEIGGALDKYLAKGKAISSQDISLPEELLKTASRRCWSCTRTQSCATQRKRRVDYLWKLCGRPGC